LLAFAAFLALGGCMAPDESQEPVLDEVYLFTDPDVAIAWSELAEETAFALGTAATDPFPNARAMTMVFLAMHDALNAIEPRYHQYAFTGSDPSADRIAAAAQAAHDVMNNIYPSRAAQNDAELAFWLGQVPDGASKTAGISIGSASATAIINNRANDNMLVFGSYAPQNPLQPGDYRFTPPFDFVYRPAFGNATPFGSNAGSSYLPLPPPLLLLPTYAFAVNEAKNFGRLNSTFRSQNQTNFAAWWLENNEIQWGRIMRDIVDTRNLDLIDSARMFAIGFMGQIDATVAVWFAKQHYDFWRPFHAIRLADTDGNILTAPDPTWEPQHVIPPLQEYPSAHAMQCTTVAEVLKTVLGTDHVTFATQSTTALPGNPVRSFNKLTDAAKECGESRIMAGYHYRFSVDVGAAMGKKVAKKITDTKLRPR
jgi:hypothetical protein